MNWETLHAMRRATVARSALDWIALACLFASGAFWGVLFWAVLVPPDRQLPQVIIALTLTLIYALVLPLLWSMLVPTTPAGMLLQKTQHRTWGFAAILGAALFLVYHALTLIYGWFTAQPHIAAAQQALPLAIACAIAFVLVPAVCWTQVTPDQWIAQIMQAREVTRLKHALALEDAAMKAAQVRALSLINAGLANATIAERKELAAILGAGARAQQQALFAVAQTFSQLYGIEMKVGGESDPEIAGRYKDVAFLLQDGSDALWQAAEAADAMQIARPVDREPSAGASAGDEWHGPTVPHQDAQTVDRARPATAPARSCTVRYGPDADGRTLGDLTLLYDAFGGNGWMRADVERVLRLQKSAANTRINTWIEEGWAYKLTEKDRYALARETVRRIEQDREASDG